MQHSVKERLKTPPTSARQQASQTADVVLEAPKQTSNWAQYSQGPNGSAEALNEAAARQDGKS